MVTSEMVSASTHEQPHRAQQRARAGNSSTRTRQVRSWASVQQSRLRRTWVDLNQAAGPAGPFAFGTATDPAANESGMAMLAGPSDLGCANCSPSHLGGTAVTGVVSNAAFRFDTLRSSWPSGGCWMCHACGEETPDGAFAGQHIVGIELHRRNTEPPVAVSTARFAGRAVVRRSRSPGQGASEQ
jgi:hypothetical protein